MIERLGQLIGHRDDETDPINGLIKHLTQQMSIYLPWVRSV